MQVITLGENTFIVKISDEISIKYNIIAQNLSNYIKENFYDYVVDVFHTYNEVCITFKDKSNKKELLKTISSQGTYESSQDKFIYHIPVHYGEKFALDLKNMSEKLCLTTDEIIDLHSKKVYRIYFIGFLPLFPYLSDLDKRIHFQRKKTPRVRVKKGSVGIANDQTGIYTLDSPGGWQIIGKTPVDFLDVDSNNPFKIESGNFIKFYPINLKEYFLIEKLSRDKRYLIQREYLMEKKYELD